LGKTFTAIAVLHAVLTQPSMVSKESNQGLLRHVLLVVPVNTLANWEQEFEKWTGDLVPSITVHNLSSSDLNARGSVISRWRRRGGVLLVSDRMYSLLSSGKSNKDKKNYKDELQPDVLVLDEAHTMLKNAKTEIFKALEAVQTKRKILLTGSPFQNNLLEYYRMCEFIRPGVFGVASETQFDQQYAEPIMSGMANDSSKYAHALSVSKAAELNDLLAPYINRVDVSVLSKDLPAMSQVVLHVRQSRIQSRLYQTFQRAQKQDPDLKGFFRMFSELRPIHNHPFCLRIASERQLKRRDSSTDESATTEKSTSWWESGFVKKEKDPLDDVESGYKIVLLLHIL
jgi:SNF2 family DNA or RNA helicase